MPLHWLQYTFQFLSVKDIISCSKVNKVWHETTEIKLIVQYASLSPLSTADFVVCPRACLSQISSLVLSNEQFDQMVLIRAFPFLESLRRLDLSALEKTQSIVKSIAKNTALLPNLHYLNISNQQHDFQFLQQFAQTRTHAELVFDNSRFTSPPSSHATQITFCNLLSFDVTVKWIDFTNEFKFYMRLRPRQHYSQDTFKSHAWVITDKENKIILRTVGTKKPQVIKIGKTLPSLIPIPQPLTTVARANPTKITIINNTQLQLFISSIDEHGKEQKNLISGILTRNTSCCLSSFATVPWIVRAEGYRPVYFIVSFLRTFEILHKHKKQLYLRTY